MQGRNLFRSSFASRFPVKALSLAIVSLSLLSACDSNDDPAPPTPDTTAPSIPGNVTATAVGSSRIDLAWTASTDSQSPVASYRIFRNGGATAIAAVTATIYSDTLVNEQTTYSYTIAAVDTAGNVSALSNAAAATTGGSDTTAPTVPANVMASAVSSTRIDLTWQPSTDSESAITSYRIFRDGSPTPLTTVTAPTTTFSDTTVSAQSTYNYTIAAVDAADNVSALSAPAAATTPASDLIPPTVPMNVVATAISGSRIDLAWQASTDVGSGVASYRIFRNGGVSAIATVTTSTYSDTSVSPQMAYSYTVSAMDNAGNVSALSSAASATTPASPTGLDTRPVNTTCVAWNRPTAGNSITLTRAFPSLPEFDSPIAALQAPGNSNRWFVVEQNGFVRAFDNVATVSAASTFIDIDARVAGGGGTEMGLLGMAFHPNYPTDTRVFLSYTGAGSSGTAATSRISSFRTTDGGRTLDPNSELVLLSIDQPETNHNGGNIAFGPDGYLYIGIGDGGSGNDPHGDIGNGQRLTTMLGKMLRIDVNSVPSGFNYGIPSTNPYANEARCPSAGRASGNCPEIYAYGLRNPWRWSFDRENGDLWVGDVGQNAFEEVDRVTLGGNYGWRCREAASNTGLECGSPTNMIDPVARYGRSFGVSITGGYVYRGQQSTTLRGKFIFGDFSSGRIFSWGSGDSATSPPQLLESGVNISSFAQDNDGELYVVDYNGTLRRIVFEVGAGGSVPNSLVNTGCVNPTNPTQPASGLIPYSINAPFWSDGATKERWMGLPPPPAIQTIQVQSDDDWEFPSGTVLVKNFRVDNQLIETRLLMRHLDDGTWSGYTYRWNDAQTTATRVQGGAVRTLANSQSWLYPSESECLQCHTAVTGRVLGPETAQMNRTFGYPPPGRAANQIATLNFLQMLTPALNDPATLPNMPDPNDTAANLAQRARAYLHTNCSQCHRPGSGIAQMDLRYTTLLSAMNVCDAPVQTSNLQDLGMPTTARLIAPGLPNLSVLHNRMNRRDAHGMPRVGSATVDLAGVALVNQWITSLTCN
jgi:uncharacterized repeat protein (TIGR03806 family)